MTKGGKKMWWKETELDRDEQHLADMVNDNLKMLNLIASMKTNDATIEDVVNEFVVKLYELGFDTKKAMNATSESMKRLNRFGSDISSAKKRESKENAYQKVANAREDVEFELSFITNEEIKRIKKQFPDEWEWLLKYYTDKDIVRDMEKSKTLNGKNRAIKMKHDKYVALIKEVV